MRLDDAVVVRSTSAIARRRCDGNMQQRGERGRNTYTETPPFTRTFSRAIFFTRTHLVTHITPNVRAMT